MKADLDKLMKDNKIDVLLVAGNAQHNPAMVYLTGGGHINDAILIKKRGQEPVLFHNSMERDEAARTGLKTISFSKYPLADLLKEASGNYSEALAIRLKKMPNCGSLQAG